MANQEINPAPGHYTLQALQGMPTLHQGHYDNLKIQGHDQQGRPARVWLSRMTVHDGAPYDNQVTVECYLDLGDGRAPEWHAVQHYQAR